MVWNERMLMIEGLLQWCEELVQSSPGQIIVNHSFKTVV